MSRVELIRIKGVGKRFGGFTALDGVDLSVHAGERFGIIGPNGSGKTTLVNCISGTLQNESGSVLFEGRAVDGLPPHQRTKRGIARSFQLPRPFRSMTLADNLKLALLYTTFERPEYGNPTPSALAERSRSLLARVGLDGKADRYPRELTQIEMRKLELARAMASDPKLLIADEAMAGLSHSEVDQILDLLRQLTEQGVAVIMIEHIMRAVMSFCERLAVLVAGKKIAEGNPKDVVEMPDVIRSYLGE